MSKTNPSSHASEALKKKQALLALWKERSKVTYADMGKVLGGVSANAVHQALKADRIPVSSHAALLSAYPDLPLEALPIPANALRGRKPKLDYLQFLAAAAT